jgi:DNA-directed RNA polymerase alpha subunit
MKNSKILWLDPIFTPVLKVNYIIESFGSLELNQANQVILLELWTNGSLHPRDALYTALSELNTMFSKLEKMKILNSIFAKSILNSNKFYPKMLKKVKYNYGYYKSNALNKKILNLKQNIGISHLNKKSDILSISDNKVEMGDFNLKSQISSKNQFESLIQSSNQGFEPGAKGKKALISSFKDLGIECLELPFRIKNCLINANFLTIQNLLNCQIDDLKQIPGMGNQSVIILLKKLNEKGLKLKNEIFK